MAYPNSIDTFGSPSGTQLLSSPSHSLDHRTLGSAVGTIEGVLGTTAGTGVLKNFTAGKLAVFNTGGTLDAGVLGTPMVRGGTVGTAVIGTSFVQGGTLSVSVGTLNNMVLGTPTVVGGSVAVSGTTVALTMGAGLVPTGGSVADSAGGTLTVNAQAANVYQSVWGTAAGNRTIGTPLNPTGWQSLTYFIKTSGSANGTLVWPSGAFTFSQDVGTPQVGTGVAWHSFAWRYNPIASRWQFQGQSLNII